LSVFIRLSLYHFSPAPTIAELNCRQTALLRTLAFDAANLNRPKPLNSHQSTPSAPLLGTGSHARPQITCYRASAAIFTGAGMQH